MSPNTTWTSETQTRITTVLEKLGRMSQQADELNLVGQERDSFLENYRVLLDKLYTEDLRLARLLDESDLLVGADGPRLRHDRLPVTAVIGLLEKTRIRVVDVVKTIATITGRVPPDVQPHLHGLAPGSVYIGFSAPPAPDGSVFGDDTPYFAAVKSAMRAMRLVGHLVADEAAPEELAEAVPDPGTRDAAMAAVRDLAPSKWSSYERLLIGGQESISEGRTAAAVLDSNDRDRLKESLVRPVTETFTGTFVGTIREMDLDKRRFYLRQIDGLEENASIRGVYPEEIGGTPRDLLDRRVRVTGAVESDPSGRPKLLFATAIELVAARSTAESRRLY